VTLGEGNHEQGIEKLHLFCRVMCFTSDLEEKEDLDLVDQQKKKKSGSRACFIMGLCEELPVLGSDVLSPAVFITMWKGRKCP